uniref:P-type domain-containing protein n=1 Tax=Caenorhabditis japonica TaxID=281687 RepID=A0A8R1HPV8_CAEJA
MGKLPILLLSIALVLTEAGPRFDCYPEPNGATQQACEARGCVWSQDNSGKNAPWCYFKDGVGYNLDSQSGSTYNLRKNNGPGNPWGGDFTEIKLTTKTIGNVLNVKVGVDGRYEPPVDFPRSSIPSSDSLTLETSSGNDFFSFGVVRQSSNRKLFDTSIGGLIFSDKFIQIATYLPSENMYGWGENTHQSLRHDFTKYLTWAMLARDQPPNSGSLDTMNLYGVHPYYIVVEPDGKAHGVLIVNSNAQEVTTAPGPSLIYRTIGGNLDMYFFPGPSPEEVTRQYLAFVGKPFLPAYWALGYQLSRYGYKGLAEMKTRIQAVRDAGIPIDIGVADIDYMQRYKDFTTGDDWSGFSDYMKDMHSWGMKLILIFDPAIEATYPSFQRAISANAKFIEWENKDQVQQDIQNLYPMAKDTKIMLGVVWPDNHVAFPDFLDSTNNTQNWWIQEFVNYQSQVPFDGIWIDMNEPSNFGTNQNHPWYFDSDDHPNDAPLFCPTNGSSAWEMPPYKTHAVWRFGDASSSAFLASNTLCMVGLQDAGNQRFYNVKNIYGLTESVHTQKALFKSTGKRGAVVSRSTFPSSGRYAGHWLGDNTARWEDLRTSVIGAQEFNLFGIPYVGSDVCGFIGTTNEELCLRWQQMGAFHSFFRNHNTIGAPAQDPAIWPSVAAATKQANLFRYQYLPYLFSLHFLASMNGGTVIRPVFFEFPTDEETFDLGYEFLWGSQILVAPVVYQGATSVDVYLPTDRWYSLFDWQYGSIVPPGYATVSAPTTSRIPVFVRGMSIIPRQTPSTTTTATRLNPFELLIAPCEMGRGKGSLYWDDGETIVNDFDSHDYHQFDFKYNTTDSGATLAITHSRKSSKISLPTLDIIEIFNYPKPPNFRSFTINGQPVNINVQKSTYSGITKTLYISTPGLIDLTYADSIALRWNNAGSAPGADGAKLKALESNRYDFEA